VLREGAGGRDGGVVAVQFHEPCLRRLADRRDRERELIPVGVHQDEEIVVEQRRAVVGIVGRVGAVEVDRDRVHGGVGPLLLGHGLARAVVPAELGRLGAGEEPPAAEDRVLAAQREHPLHVAVQVVVRVRPVEPGDLVVLAVGVVVAVLGAADLVAAEQQRQAERQQQRRQDRPGLAFAQRVDSSVVGDAFRAAVPGAVVAGAVAVVLAVRLVVLIVVGDQVAQREPVVHGDQVHRGGRAAAVGAVQV